MPSQTPHRPSGPTLSKSTFLRGLQCQKSLALDALRPDLRDPLDLPTQFRMRMGQEVGMLARRCYPGGSVARIPDSFLISHQRTRDLIEGGETVIYEASLEAQGVRIVADVLVRGQRGWRLIEIKSATEARPEHAWDIAVQVYVARRAGLDLEDALLLHPNKEYVRRGELDYTALFSETPLSAEAEELQPEVERVIARSLDTLRSGEVPQVEIGPHCRDPVDCDFIGYCWGHLPDPSVFDVYYIGKRAHDLYARGIEHIEDIPADYPLDKRSAFHVQAHKAGETIVNPSELRRFVDGLIYPVYYLDFETFSVPVPPFDGLSPYTKVPFQYSLHIQEEPGGALAHSGFLAQADIDPRREFLDRLLDEIGTQGSILVYYLPFERGVLQALRESHPEYGQEIEGLIDRMVDLLDPFRQRAYWHPMMGGSNSLKQVLPVFAPDLSYQEMDITNGEEAMAIYLGYGAEDVLPGEGQRRQALWEYCKLDTLAMVRILEGLRGAAGM